VGRLRAATVSDLDRLLSLWALVHDGGAGDGDQDGAWRRHAHDWFVRVVDDGAVARIPVVDLDGVVVATAIGTLEIGVPNPHCPRGRAVRLANVITVPEHRGRGFGTLLVGDVVEWARSIDADRVDLSATPDGARVYERAGFIGTSAPRMKLVLQHVSR
jgi:GNAT superfamily N-acetyltransferase